MKLAGARQVALRANRLGEVAPRQIGHNQCKLSHGASEGGASLGTWLGSTAEIGYRPRRSCRILAEILHIADDAQMEGRTSMVNHNAIVEAAGTLRRIANRLASIATGRIVTPVPQLDPMTESAHAAVFDAIRRRLQSWLDFFRVPRA